MWMAIQLTICVVFLLAVTFYVGRFFGKRKYLKLHEEMKALELSFNQVVEEMELASSHNLKVLEKQSEELSELLTVADKKILQINDFLSELDFSTKNLKKSGKKAGPAMPDPVVERKMKKELSELSDNISRQIEILESQIFQVAQSIRENHRQPSDDFVSSSEIKSLIEQEVTRQVSRQLQVFEQQSYAVSPDSEMDSFRTKSKSDAQKKVSIPKRIAKAVAENGKIAELRTSRFADNIKMPKGDRNSELQMPKPPVGSPVHEVLEMAQNGVTLPQIARRMGMGKGEIELILKIYGSEIEMRNVV